MDEALKAALESMQAAIIEDNKTAVPPWTPRSRPRPKPWR